MLIQGQRYNPPPASLGVGATPNINMDNVGAAVMSELQGRYGNLAYQKSVFMAHAIVTAPVAYTTAAGVGGPLLWNGSIGINAQLLAVGFGVTVASTAAVGLGITGNSGQPAAPTTTTAIDSRANLNIGGAASQCTPYRIGTVANAGNFFMPIGDLSTGALTTTEGGFNWIDLGGMIIVPPQCWAALSASAVGTTAVIQACLIYAELPV